MIAALLRAMLFGPKPRPRTFPRADAAVALWQPVAISAGVCLTRLDDAIIVYGPVSGARLELALPHDNDPSSSFPPMIATVSRSELRARTAL